MILLNYIYFLIITFLGGKFLTSKQTTLKNPLNKEQTMLLDGPEMFWILTFSTGLLALGAPGTIDLMAIRLLVLELFCLFGLFVCKRKPQWSFPIVCYLLYILWLFIGLIYSPTPAYGFRVILKYIYPLLIMLFASAAVRDREVFLASALGARIVAIISIAIFFLPLVGRLFPGVFWYGTASAINYISMCVLSLGLFFFSNEKKKNLWLTIFFIIPCILWVFRTSIMGTTLALMIFAFFKYKIKALPVLVGVLLLFIAAIFTIPSVKQKMFYNDENQNVSKLESGEISFDDIDSNGRFAMWRWSLEQFYEGKELIGTGPGNLQEVFYSLKHPFESIRIIHSDYVQILCDSGLIGIFLFGFSFLFLIIHSFRVYNNSSYDNSIRLCAIVAGSSAAGVLLTMQTDNVINYSMATISYPCGFYGMMLGMIAKTKNK